MKRYSNLVLQGNVLLFVHCSFLRHQTLTGKIQSSGEILESRSSEWSTTAPNQEWIATHSVWLCVCRKWWHKNRVMKLFLVHQGNRRQCKHLKIEVSSHYSFAEFPIYFRINLKFLQQSKGSSALWFPVVNAHLYLFPSAHTGISSQVST